MGVDHKMAQQYVTFTSLNYPDHAMRHCNYEGFLNEHEEDNEDFQFVMVAGLTDRRKVSFESVNFPGYFLRHQCFRMKLHERDGSELFDNDATFEMVRPNAECECGQGFFSFRSVNFPDRCLRHKNFELWLDENDGSELFDQDTTFNLFSPACRLKSMNFPPHSMRHCNYEFFNNETEYDNEDFLLQIRPGNFYGEGVSFESVNFPGHFVRHQGFRVKLHESSGDDWDDELFQLDTTFVITRSIAGGHSDGYFSITSINYPDKSLRHKNWEMWLEEPGSGPDEDFSWKLRR